MLVDPETFLASPIGRAAASAHILCWFPDERLRVTAAWGDPTVDDVAFLLRVLDFELAPGRPRHGSFVDLRQLAGEIDPVAYERLVRYVSSRRDRFAEVITSSVILHGGGPQAAVVAGYSRIAGEPFPVILHVDPAEASAAAGRPDGAIVRELSLLVARVRADTPLVRRARDWISTHLTDPTLESCAKHLAVSTRTLQRKLLEEGTSFRAEVERIRVERAKRILERTDDKVLAVAVAVGYPKVQNLAAAFRRQTGMTPSQWRRTRK